MFGIRYLCVWAYFKRHEKDRAFRLSKLFGHSSIKPHLCGLVRNLCIICMQDLQPYVYADDVPFNVHSSCAVRWIIRHAMWFILYLGKLIYLVKSADACSWDLLPFSITDVLSHLQMGQSGILPSPGLALDAGRQFTLLYQAVAEQAVEFCWTSKSSSNLQA